MNCYIVRFRVLPYKEYQYMHMFASDQQAAIKAAADVFMKKKIVIAPHGAVLDKSPVWSNRPKRGKRLRARWMEEAR